MKILMVFGFIGLLLLSGCTSLKSEKIVDGLCKYEENDIIAVNYGTEMHGSFFLAIGSVGDSSYYHVMALQPDGSYKLQKDSVDSVSIFEGNYTPVRRVYTTTTRLRGEKTCEYSYGVYYFVPKGTIIRRLSIDIGD